MHIFLDESGQFTKDGDGNRFVVASFTVGDPRRTEKRFCSWQRERFPRIMRDQPEIKFSAVNITDELRLKTLAYIASLDVRIRYAWLDPRNIPAEYRQRASLRSGELYTAVVGETVAQHLPAADRELRILCDQRHLKGITRSAFREDLRERLLPVMPGGSLVQVEMVDSAASANIQIADWVAGALAAYINGKPRCEDYRLILKGNIISGQELFKGSWESGRK